MVQIITHFMLVVTTLNKMAKIKVIEILSDSDGESVGESDALDSYVSFVKSEIDESSGNRGSLSGNENNVLGDESYADISESSGSRVSD